MLDTHEGCSNGLVAFIVNLATWVNMLSAAAVPVKTRGVWV